MKEFDINATPTLILNNQKFDKTLSFKNLKKAIEKLNKQVSDTQNTIHRINAPNMKAMEK